MVDANDRIIVLAACLHAGIHIPPRTRYQSPWDDSWYVATAADIASARRFLRALEADDDTPAPRKLHALTKSASSA